MNIKSISRAAACAAVASFGIACGSANTKTVSPPDPWVITIADEFDGPALTPPNPAIWTYDIGGDGWGNEQLEFDTDRVENVSLDGQGNLRIAAIRESYMGRDYTSARIKTKGLAEQKFGRFEARIKLPGGQGIWPAFWMLGANFDEAGWPQTGEIDIMEFRGQAPELIYGSLHGPGYSAAEAITGTFRLPDGEVFTDDFHVFAVEWNPGGMIFSVDGEVYQTVSSAEVSERGDWVFDHEFFMLLNLAVGGGFVGPVGPDVVFPAEMLVDYVRIFERSP